MKSQPEQASLIPVLTEADKNARRAKMLAALEQAHVLADQLRRAVSTAFPDAAKKVARSRIDLSHLSVEERLAMGSEAAGELEAVAYALDPVGAAERLETRLPQDESSKRIADTIIAKAAA